MEKIIIKVASLVVNKKNPEEILLIKEKTEKNDLAKWNVLKGTCLLDKETVFQAAERECFEEASIKIKLTKSLGCYLIKKHTDGFRIQFNFIAEIVSGVPRVQDKKYQDKLNENITELRWFNKSQIKKMGTEEFVSKRTKMVLMDWIGGKTYPLEMLQQM
ncbi:MAG: Nudix hydrolase protein [Patescibacteria group bacterium]|nr:Nudix hydrolase protein [Patescibacteria group bacterium]